MGGLTVPELDGATPWTKLPDAARQGWFNFVLVGDRTGGARPGVFERGLACADLLAPTFAIQLGDLIEGYTDDAAELDQQWSEMDSMLGELRTPLFHVPGNHDVSTPEMAAVWDARYGCRYYHFRYDDVLFLVVDTQDPPFDLPPEALAGLRAFDVQIQKEPARMRRLAEQYFDWEGKAPANVSDEQHEYFERVLAEHADARWTFVCMHMPMWQGEHPAWDRLRAALGDRPYTAFAGHVHNYQRRVIDDRDHIRLGPTGGLWVLGGPDGNFDHVTLVTMTDTEPVITGITLNGVRDSDGQPILPVTLMTVPVT
ncbi:MAG: metallophosphoesterase [Acidimicrobiia bacterium]